MNDKNHIQDYGIPPLRVGTVCSGIGAPECGMKELPFEFVWSSEIEPFPCRVLKHHYPDVPNLGDMTKLFTNETFINEPISILIGGTPCQSFSIAGLRGGLDDDRGNLSLVYCRILMVKQPKWFIWENVPGVLSSSDGADFAAILSGFTGKDIKPQKFAEAGIIQGELYSISWRVLDSQYFGVPQRRKRVFVVGHLGDDWRPSAAVLFERDSLSRDTTPRREARKEAAGASGEGAEVSGGDDLLRESGQGFWMQDDKTGPLRNRGERPTYPSHVVFQTNVNQEVSGSVSKKWAKGSGGPAGDKKDNRQRQSPATIANTLDTKLGDKMGLDNQHIDSGATHFVPFEKSIGSYGDDTGAIQARYKKGVGSQYVEEGKIILNPVTCIQTAQTGANGSNISEDQSYTLNKADVPAIVYDTTQITSPENGSNPKEEICHTLNKNAHVPLLVNEVKAFQQNADGEVRQGEISGTLNKNSNASGRNTPMIYTHIARRLTPKECLRLQGFPDDYLDIAGASDSAKYAAVGNSMTTHMLRWLGHRIALFEKVSKKATA